MQTTAAISLYLPRVLTELVYDYFKPQTDDDFDIAQMGCYELCSLIKFPDVGLMGACEGGYVEIVKMMIGRGATVSSNCLDRACVGNQADLAVFVIESSKLNWNDGLRSACAFGSIELAKLVIGRGATDFDGGMFWAVNCGQVGMVDLMIEYGVTVCPWCKEPIGPEHHPIRGHDTVYA